MARPPKFDDEQVLDRAMAAFWDGGWCATSVRDLERRLELKAPSIYRRFGSKEKLEVAVLERYLNRVIRRRIDRHLDGTGDPLANLWTFVATALTPPDPDRALRGCLLTVTALEAPRLAPELGDLLAAGLTEVEAAMAAELARAEHRGWLAPGLDAGAAAGRLALSFQGLMVLARGGRPPDELVARAATVFDGLVAPDAPRPWGDHPTTLPTRDPAVRPTTPHQPGADR